MEEMYFFDVDENIFSQLDPLEMHVYALIECGKLYNKQIKTGNNS